MRRPVRPALRFAPGRLAAVAVTTLCLAVLTGCSTVAPAVGLRADAGAVLTAQALPSDRCPQVRGRGTWGLTVATWNLLNLSDRKAGLPPNGPLNTQLLDRYADILSRYDAICVEELLNGGASLTQAIAQRPAMANYNCQYVSAASGRIGRQERYGICYAGAGLALNGVYDYMGTQVTAVNGTLQTAQNVWMRPPIRASFTYTPPSGPVFDFQVYCSHTKPAYGASGVPPGTPAGAANNQSVYYELQAEENNPRPGDTNTIVLGDLNTDCASYPARDRNQNYQAGWTWYPPGYGMVATNTAPLSTCTYDRQILNAAANTYYCAHGVYANGINVRLNNKRVSDHYLVWTLLGNREPPAKRKRLMAATATPVVSKQRRLFKAATIGGPPLLVNGIGLNQPIAVTTADLYIMVHDENAFYAGNQTYPLRDVRGAPSTVTLDSSGAFTRDVTWSSPTGGSYSLILDVNRDGFYDKGDGDFTNYPQQIDFLVTTTTEVHSDVVTLGDNGQLRELFSADKAKNVYAAARGLPASQDVGVWIVAMKLLPPGFPGWEAARAQGNLQLSTVSVPVNVREGGVYVPDVTTAEQLQTLTTGPDGTLFASVWPQPSVLFGMRALARVPPTPTYDPSYDCDPEEDPVGCHLDPCQDAWKSNDANFQAVCNVGSQFSDYYGTAFNTVIDVNGDGVFNGPDLVDVYDVGDMTAWFQSHSVLGPGADGNPAVGEYKAYLDAKLNLSRPLPDTDVYDGATADASFRYMCSGVVPSSRFPVIQTGAQIGFRVLDGDSYEREKQAVSGVYAYDDVVFDDYTVGANQDVCVVAEGDAGFNGTTVETGSTTVVQAQQPVVTGDVVSHSTSTLCLLAAQNLTFAAGLGGITVAAPNPVTGLGAVFFGIVGTATGVACELSGDR